MLNSVSGTISHLARNGDWSRHDGDVTGERVYEAIPENLGDPKRRVVRCLPVLKGIDTLNA